MMYGYGFNGTDGWWMVATMVIVALTVLGSVWLVVHRPGAAMPQQSSAEETLRDRFARGEITAEQSDEAKKRLG